MSEEDVYNLNAFEIVIIFNNVTIIYSCTEIESLCVIIRVTLVVNFPEYVFVNVWS